MDQVDPNDLVFLFGVFRTKSAVEELIRTFANEFKLCRKVLGIEIGKGVCFAYQLHECTGACAGKEKHELHHLKQRNSLIRYKLKTWPYQGKVGVKEINLETNKIVFISLSTCVI